MPMDLEQDHGAIAWENWTDQFSESGRLEAFVKALYKPTSGINAAWRGLRDSIWLQSATGKQLDGIGEIVGLAREPVGRGWIAYFGFREQPGITGFNDGPIRNDEDINASGLMPDRYYRLKLAWKIAVNNGHGTTEEIISSLKTMFGAGRIIVRDLGDAKIRVTLDRVPYISDALLRTAREYVPKLAGVDLMDFNVGGLKTFGFRDQTYYFGFGEGTIAHRVA